MTNSKTNISEPSGHYTLAGWVAIVQAVLVIPQIILAVGVEFLSRHYPPLRLVLVVLSAAGTIAGVYVLYILKRLLNDRFRFHDVDVFIVVFIAINIFMFFLGMAGMIEEFELSIAIITGVIFLIYGILNIAFGVTILKLRESLFGLLKPFAYLTIGHGILTATIILAPLGMILEIIALVVQGMIFLRASEESEYL